MTDQDDPDERRTEGVRIIGAQEAAEAAGRPDVVRRRRGGEKRFGDRPDKPAPASDLPKITISTTEGDPSHPDRFGSVPVVRPEGGEASPQWADDGDELYGPTDDDGTRINVGHARIVPAAEDDPFAPAHAEDPYDLPDATPDPYAPSYEQSYEPDPNYGGDVYAEPDPFAADDDADGAGRSDDDSFVLPHWTEPPTGQVPKVVIGDDAPEPESLATYGSQPRWRDEGERTAVTDFDDLAEDGPRLGALSGDAGASVDEDFFSPAQFADDEDLGEYEDDEIEDFSPVGDFDDLDSTRSATRQRRRQPDHPDQARGDGQPPSGGGDRNIVTAVLVGVGLVIIGLVCFYFGAVPTAVLVTAIVTFAAFEYFTAVRTAGHNPATLLGLVAVAGVVFTTFTAGLSAYPIVLGITVISGLLWYLWVAPGEHSTTNLGLTFLGVMWIGLLGSFATLFLGLGKQMEDVSSSITSNPGIGVLIAAVVAAVAHDVGAYFVGRQFGSTPLSAASPNKTQEGLIGGVLVSIVVTFLVVGVGGIDPIGESYARAFVFALLCALVAPLGDLSESLIKRDLKVKDMGTVLPGHGGVLDRFDALLFVLPTAYFVTVLFDVWKISGS